MNINGKNNVSLYSLIFIGYIAFSFLSSCSDDKNDKARYDPSKPVIVTSFTPDSGRIAEKLFSRRKFRIRSEYNQSLF